MSRLATDVHLVDGPHGMYFIGNLQFPASVDTTDLVIKVYPEDGRDDEEFNKILKRWSAEYEGKVIWSVEVEPRHKKPNGDKK